MKLVQGQLLVNDGEVYIVARTSQKAFNLISTRDGNRWTDDGNQTLEDIEGIATEHHFKLLAKKPNSKLFQVVKEKEKPQQDRVWITRDGRVLKVSEIENIHLVNILNGLESGRFEKRINVQTVTREDLEAEAKKRGIVATTPRIWAIK